MSKDTINNENVTPSILDIADDEIDKIDWNTFMQEDVDDDLSDDEDSSDTNLINKDGEESENDKDKDKDKEDLEGNEVPKEDDDDNNSSDDHNNSKNEDLNDEDLEDDGEDNTKAKAKSEEDDDDIKDSDNKDEKKDAEDGKIDYKAEFEKLTSPFKANGELMQINSTDEAIRLMQMGANYHDKMLALKPNLMIAKMLDKNNLLDADKISLLIDAYNKDKNAIKELIKNSGLKVFDLESDDDGNITQENDYKPNDHTLNETEMAFNSVIDSIKSTPTYNQTIDTIDKTWDSISQEYLYKHPTIISAINENVADGVFDIISAEMKKRKMLGEAEGIPDVTLYHNIGEEFYKAGKFVKNGTVDNNSARSNVKDPVNNSNKSNSSHYWALFNSFVCIV